MRELQGFSLAQAGIGEQVEIVAFDGGRNAHRRLSDLGLARGQHVSIVTKQPGSPVLVALGSNRIAIGFGLALKIRVIPVVGGSTVDETL